MKAAYTVLDPSSSPAQDGVCALGIMIKAPRAGAVKTRLVPPLDHDEAARLSVCFLRDTAENIASVTFEEPAEGIAVYTPVGSERAFDGLLCEGFKLVAQRGDAFGERLFHAAEDLLALGYESLCLIDSDSPTLPRACLAEAVRVLAVPGDRIVLGPSDDGGYYLIGLKHAHSRVFERINWSTSLVLEETIERAHEIGLEVTLLPAWYDVDDGVTLSRLCAELFLPGQEGVGPKALAGYWAAHTRRYLSRLIEREGRERIWPSGGTRRGAAI
jgi:rSAM/selenodomain-associated transferase 1